MRNQSKRTSFIMHKFMTLKEIIQQEEKLLKIDDKYKHKLTFNEVVRLKGYMRKVGEITNIYFELINSYHKDIAYPTSGSVSTSDIVNDMYDYNDLLQQSEVDTDLINMTEIIGFINIISEKYSIVFNLENKTIEN